MDNLFDKYNNGYLRTIKMDPVVVNSSKSVNSDVENDDKDPKFKVGDHVRTSKLKNNFAKDYTPN